jgi:hypothetical protein
MNSKRFFEWRIPAGIMLCLFLLFVSAGAALAQETSPAPETMCVACHADLYENHDEGKYFCLCVVGASCTDCHAGNPEALTADEAHVGLVTRPCEGGLDTCAKCHPQDCADRAATFAQVAGFQPTPLPAPTATPFSSAVRPQLAPTQVVDADGTSPWRTVGLAVTGMFFVGFVVYGFRLWWLDRSAG